MTTKSVGSSIEHHILADLLHRAPAVLRKELPQECHAPVMDLLYVNQIVRAERTTGRQRALQAIARGKLLSRAEPQMQQMVDFVVLKEKFYNLNPLRMGQIVRILTNHQLSGALRTGFIAVFSRWTGAAMAQKSQHKRPRFLLKCIY